MFESIFPKKEKVVDNAKKLRDYSLVAIAAATMLLESCSGSKERASTQDIKNHIENVDLEKVNPEYVKNLEEKLAKNSSRPISMDRSMQIESGVTGHDFYHISENDSDIVLDVHSLIDGPRVGSDVFYHVEIDKKTGVVVLYAKKNMGDEVVSEGGNSASMIVNKDGKVISDNYREGDAKFQFEVAASEFSVQK